MKHKLSPSFFSILHKYLVKKGKREIKRESCISSSKQIERIPQSPFIVIPYYNQKMLLKETIQKTLENFKHLFSKGFQKLQKPTSLIPFSCSKGNPNPTGQLYIDVYDSGNAMVPSVTSDETETIKRRLAWPVPKENIKQEDTNVGKEEQSHLRKKPTGTGCLRKGNVKNMSTRSDGLAQKMKDLEMFERGDMEQELDIEEAIHYYSRLRSPVYLEIVDKFFMDIHSEFSVLEPSAKSMKSSKRRIGSMRL